MVFAIPTSVSELRRHSTFSAISNPAFSMSRTVSPTSGDRWAPVTTSFGSRSGCSCMRFNGQKRCPKSARELLMTVMVFKIWSAPIEMAVNRKGPTAWLPGLYSKTSSPGSVLYPQFHPAVPRTTLDGAIVGYWLRFPVAPDREIVRVDSLGYQVVAHRLRPSF